MKRFIRYLYEYQNGKRTRNTGFVKVLEQTDTAEIQIYGRGFPVAGGRTLEIYKGGREQCDGYSDELARATYNGYGMRKFLRDRSTEVGGKFYSCPLIRLPEIYLNIAEAMNELGKATEKDEFGRDAYDYVNLVRERVKMPALTNQKVASGLPLREAILHERAVEMGFEEVRYFDLVRWKRSDLFKTDIERLVITRNEDGSFDYVRDNKIANPRGWIKRWTDRSFLFHWMKSTRSTDSYRIRDGNKQSTKD